MDPELDSEPFVAIFSIFRLLLKASMIELFKGELPSALLPILIYRLNVWLTFRGQNIMSAQEQRSEANYKKNTKRFCTTLIHTETKERKNL